MRLQVAEGSVGMEEDKHSWEGRGGEGRGGEGRGGEGRGGEGRGGEGGEGGGEGGEVKPSDLEQLHPINYAGVFQSYRRLPCVLRF